MTSINEAIVTYEGLGTAVFLVLALGVAGIAHSLWLSTAWSARFGRPIDLGLSIRGRRIFGANKTWRGLMIMPPAAGVVFYIAAAWRHALPDWIERGMWPLGPAQYAALGLACGLAFMLAELPNSFMKRQLGISPGLAPTSRGLAILCLVIDRIDSVLGVLVVLSFLVQMSLGTWIWALVLGAGVHGLFSIWLYRMRLKARPL
jgi:hypothetical protein